MLEKTKKMIDCQRPMRDLIVFEKKVEDRPFDDLENYKPFKKLYGDIRHFKSRLLTQARSENTKQYIVVVVRYREDLDESMRMTIGNDHYQIESIIPLTNENLYLEVTGYRFKNDMVGDFNE